MNSEFTSLFSLTGRKALITGGTSGIGLMLGRALMLAGADVILVGRNADTCQEKVKELTALVPEGGSCDFIAADLSTEAGVNDLAEAASNKASDLSLLFNNAGMTAHAPLGDYPGSNFDAVMGLNVKIPFLLTQALLPVLKANATADQPAHVVNTGSIGGIVHDTPDSFAYGPSKTAIHHMTKVLAKRLAPEHVLVNAIAPGLFPSKMSAWITDDDATHNAVVEQIPTGRLGCPDDIARSVIALVAGNYQTGTVVVLDGGLSL